MQEGNRIDMKLPLDEQKLAELCKTGRTGKWGPLTTPYPESMRAEKQKEEGDESVFTPETHLRYARSSLLVSPFWPSPLPC